jgi:arabinofuranan 3-O-arabinosyltransferase
LTAPAIRGGLGRYLRGTDDMPPDTGTARPPQAGRPNPWSAASGRWFLLVWLTALIVLAANDPGRMIFDTKLGVDINAAGFFSRLWPLWNPLEWFGTLQDQYIGYAVPMASFYVIGQFLHMPVWFIERLWLSALIAAGFWGMTRLATASRIGSDGSRLLAGVVFALWPTFTIVIGSTSATALPGLMVPWAVLPLVGGLASRRSAVTACARSGVAVLLMGGVNAVVTIAVLLLPALYIVTHSRGRRRVLICLSWGAAVVAATAWWAVPLLLQGRYSFNFLPYVEQAATTTKTVSAGTFLRGSGNWTAYFNLGAPWLSAGWAMVANPAAIAASAVTAAAGLCGLARRDMPERLWLRLSVGVAALAALASYPGPLGGPLHGVVQILFDGTLAPFRSVYKFEPVVGFAVALGICHLLGQAGEHALPAPAGSHRLGARVVLAPAIALCLAGLALPYLTGQILQPGSFTSVPRYWSQAAAFLAAHSGNQTTLVVPGDSHGLYLWGDPIDDPLEPLASTPWVERGLVPFGGAGSQTFLDTAEIAIESGQRVPGLAEFMARAGIRYVLVRNDLTSNFIGYIPPRIVAATLTLSGFSRVASFGPLVTGAQTNQGAPAQVQAYLPKYPAIEVYQVTSAALRPSSPAVALPVSSTALVNGGPDSLLQLTGQGILGNQAAVIAGDPIAGRPAQWAVTDGQRRQDNAFGLINANTSFTYTPTETNPIDGALGGGGGPPRQILPVPAAGHQTVAVLSGAASVTASSYGSWLTYQPQYDPVHAFDGNDATAWAEGSPFTPVGQWIQIRFDRTLDLSASIGVQLLDDGFSRAIANQIQVSTAAGRASTQVVPTNSRQQLRVAPGPTKWLRITITGASNVIAGNPGAGIRDVQIPGVRVTRYLQPPEDGAGAAASSAAFSFYQPPPAPAGVADRAATEPMARLFTLDQPMPLQLTATAAAQPGSQLSALIAQLAPPRPSSLLVGASSTWGSLPTFGPDNLFGKATAPWISGTSNPVISLSWHGFRKISKIVVQPAFGFEAAPPKIKLTSFFGKREAKVGLDGVATISPPLVTDQVNLSFPGWSSVVQPGMSGHPVLGLARLTIPGLSRLHVAALNPRASFGLPCGSGPVIGLDGHDFKTSVSGTLGALAGGLPVTVKLCTPQDTADLAAGQHRLLAEPGLFSVTNLVLRTPRAGPTTATPVRHLSLLSWGADNRSIRIGPGAKAYVEVHQNANAGWVASLNGRRLTPAVLDGWQQGFVVPAGVGGVITMTFAPATWYHASLGLSVLAIIGLIVVAAGWRRWMSYVLPIANFVIIEAGTALLLRGTRVAAVWVPAEILALLVLAVAGLGIVRFRRERARRPHAPAGPAPGPGRDDSAARRHRAVSLRDRVGPWIARWTGPAALLLLIVVIGGPVALAVPVLAVVAALRPRWLPVISLVAMIASGVIAASGSGPASVGSGALGPWAQGCALVALAAALYPRRSAPAAARIGWRPARPLPGPSGRTRLPSGEQPEQPEPVGIGGPR